VYPCIILNHSASYVLMKCLIKVSLCELNIQPSVLLWESGWHVFVGDRSASELMELPLVLSSA